MNNPCTTPAQPEPAREAQLSEAFVLLVSSLVEDFDVVELLNRLVQSCCAVLPTPAAAILLRDADGELSVVASSGEDSLLLELLQLQQAEGPCLDCVLSGTPVVSLDLDADVARWPRFVPAASALGYRSVVALPLRIAPQTIGALNLFLPEPGALAPDDQRVAQALADVATISITQQRSLEHAAVLADQLQHALNSRVAIEQAKGVLSERHGLSMDQAFQALRRHARANNLKLGECATGVTLGEISLGPASKDRSAS